jgi:hypothetical protein
MVFFNSPDEKIRIELSNSQWKLLQTTRDTMDELLTRLVSVAVKRQDMYELYLTEEELDFLVSHIAGQANHADSEKRMDALDDLGDYLESFLDDDDEEGYGDDFWGPEPIVNRSEMTGSVYVFKVALADQKAIWRRIELRGGQTLHDLHMAVFEAFDREEAHLYSFYIPPKPVKTQSVRKFMEYPRFSHPYAMEKPPAEMMEIFSMVFGEPMAAHDEGNAAETQIRSLNLVKNLRMLYEFDFGDEWLHWVTVEQTDGTADDGDYPRITERNGESPPQYADNWDDDDDDDDDDE